MSSSAPSPHYRHPLGLPPGSVRALLALMVLGNIWARLLLPEQTALGLPQYLYYLMFLILGSYFAARSQKSPGERPPLYLPRGSIRLIIIAGFAAVFGWGFYHDPEFASRLQPDLTQEPHQAYLPLVILGAFLLGIVIGRFSHRLLEGPAGMPAWFQDLQAWVSLVAVILLFADTLIHLVIYPNISEERRITLPNWQYVLSAIVAFYFGVRS